MFVRANEAFFSDELKQAIEDAATAIEAGEKELARCDATVGEILDIETESVESLKGRAKIREARYSAIKQLLAANRVAGALYPKMAEEATSEATRLRTVAIPGRMKALVRGLEALGYVGDRFGDNWAKQHDDVRAMQNEADRLAGLADAATGAWRQSLEQHLDKLRAQALEAARKIA